VPAVGYRSARAGRGRSRLGFELVGSLVVEPGLNEAPVTQTGQRVTATRYRTPLTDTDRLVHAARFEEYLTWRHVGVLSPLTWAAPRCGAVARNPSMKHIPGMMSTPGLVLPTTTR
jgi:hypothetical protein